MQKYAHAEHTYLCLEAKYCHCNADDSGDPQSKKHCFCVIKTKKRRRKEEKHIYKTNEKIYIYIYTCVVVVFFKHN